MEISPSQRINIQNLVHNLLQKKFKEVLNDNPMLHHRASLELTNEVHRKLTKTHVDEFRSNKCKVTRVALAINNTKLYVDFAEEIIRKQDIHHACINLSPSVTRTVQKIIRMSQYL